jgi:hypothetical protein
MEVGELVTMVAASLVDTDGVWASNWNGTDKSSRRSVRVLCMEENILCMEENILCMEENILS